MSIFSRTAFFFIVATCAIVSTTQCEAVFLQKTDKTQCITKESERVYFDPDDFPMGEETFHIHTGGNEWIQTSTVHRDVTGFFTYTADIYCIPGSLAYQKQWKCPYCNRYWPIGQPCGNAECPSRY